MYLKDEWDLYNNELEYDGDYEELPYIYCENVEKSIKKLYSLNKEDSQQAAKIIEKCEFTIELMKNEIGAIDENLIEYYEILILAYKLFRMDEGSTELAGHVLQIKVLSSCEKYILYNEFAEMLFLLDDLIPDFDLVFYEGDFEFCSSIFYRYKMLVKCRRYIKTYNYESAYENCIILFKELICVEIDGFDSNDFERRRYINWVKKQFNILINVAKIIDRLLELEKEIITILADVECILTESEKMEFHLLLECEQCFDKCKGRREDIILKLIDIFEKEYSEGKEKGDGRVYDLYMNFLIKVSEKSSYEEKYLKLILRKIIELGKDKQQNYNYWGSKLDSESLIIAVFRLLSLEDNSANLEIKEIVKLLKDKVMTEKLGKAFVIEPILRWGMLENQEISIIMRMLSSLYNKMMDLEGYIKVKKYEEEKITYYTSMQTLGYLLMDEAESKIEKCRLSIMNVGYMNDPNEGRVINDVIEKNVNSKTREFYKFIDVNDKRIPKKADNTLIFLKSFSDKVDRLTMWSEYGDKGKGVCVVINGKTFRNAKYRMDLLKELKIHILGNNFDDYELYRVIYWNKNDNEFYANGLESAKLKGKLDVIFNLLEEIFNQLELSTFTEDNKHVVTTFLETVFSKLKYLIKFEEYKDENETRLIFQRKTVNSFSDIEEVIGDNTLKRKIYIHYPVKTMIDEIIIGPKNSESDEYIPFLLKRTSEINEFSRFCTDICKSAIDYR